MLMLDVGRPAPKCWEHIEMWTGQHPPKCWIFSLRRLRRRHIATTQNPITSPPRGGLPDQVQTRFRQSPIDQAPVARRCVCGSCRSDRLWTQRLGIFLPKCWNMLKNFFGAPRRNVGTSVDMLALATHRNVGSICGTSVHSLRCGG